MLLISVASDDDGGLTGSIIDLVSPRIAPGRPEPTPGTTPRPVTTMQRRIEQEGAAGRLMQSRFVDAVLLLAAYFIVSAAAFNGFYDKWAFRDNDARYSFVSMITGTAERPYVYRQFLPALINAAEAALPSAAKERLTKALFTKAGALRSGIRSPSALDPRYALRYHFMYYATFLFLLASLFVMRAVCLASGFRPLAAATAPGLLALFIPFLQTMGGYAYDFTELFFMAAAVLLILKGRLLALLPLTVLATSNKESFLLYVVTLYPFLRDRLPPQKAILLSGGLVGAAGMTYLAIRMPYGNNGGATALTYGLENVLFYLNPRNLLGREITYGLNAYRGYSFITLGLIGALAVRGWHGVSTTVRRHIMLAAAINLPLLLFLCYPGEMRNLSLVYTGFLLLLAQNLSGLDRGENERSPSSRHI